MSININDVFTIIDNNNEAIIKITKIINNQYYYKVLQGYSRFSYFTKNSLFYNSYINKQAVEGYNYTYKLIKMSKLKAKFYE